ncbi:MAG: IPTL-CTERM sorting domain-containing protein [Myxococcales bacterium]|nr:IPTL-CTERM sorting domain-containing protein [Myxococcales bacterium]
MSGSAIPTLSAWGTLLLGSGLLALAAARRRAL